MNKAIFPPSVDWKTSYLALAGLLVRRREALGLSQEDVAKELGVGRRSLQRWEAGDAEPPAKRMFQWAGLLGVSIAPDVAQSRAEPTDATSRALRPVMAYRKRSFSELSEARA